MKEKIQDIKDWIFDSFMTQEELQCSIKVLFNYVKHENSDFDGKHEDIEVIYKVVFAAQAIQNNFDIKSDKEEYIEALKNLKDNYKEYLKEEIEILTKYFD